MNRPTPRPWIDIEECVCEARTNEAIETSKANAAHIVKCVNLHEELVRSASELVEVLLEQDKVMNALNRKTIVAIRALQNYRSDSRFAKRCNREVHMNGPIIVLRSAIRCKWCRSILRKSEKRCTLFYPSCKGCMVRIGPNMTPEEARTKERKV